MAKAATLDDLSGMAQRSTAKQRIGQLGAAFFGPKPQPQQADRQMMDALRALSFERARQQAVQQMAPSSLGSLEQYMRGGL